MASGRIPLTGIRAPEECVHGDDYDSALERALELARERNLVFVHPFDDPDVIAGQGTVAMELLRQKMDNAKATGAKTIVTANPGCILQLRAGAKMAATGQEVMHVVELLDRATEKK